MEDKKKYKPLENILNKINKDFISLSDEEIRRNNQILGQLLDLITEKMKTKDNLFKEMYTRVFYGGSYYDGLRVGQPDEFDLDLLLTLPKLVNPTLTISNVPGYVHLQLKDLLALYKQTELAVRYKGLDKLLDNQYLDNSKVRKWMQGVVTLALNDFEKQSGKSILKIDKGIFFAKIHEAGPAFTLKVNGNINGKEIFLDIDLVPCFEFKKEHWPISPFKPNPVTTKPNFFIVPKPLKYTVPGKSNTYWRLSFQEQERQLIDKKQYLKPSLKFLKKLRDACGHKAIASYYIKTVVLWECERPNEFWSSSLSYVFMTLLKQYYEAIMAGKIQYYWNKNNNLIGNVPDAVKMNMANRIKIIIANIEKHLSDDPFKIASYLLTPTEYAQFKTANLSLNS